jgi:hypothetical protein
MSLRRSMVLIVVALAGAVTGFAQAFNSGSTGSDGALSFTTPGTIDFDPVALGLNPAGDNIFNFTTVNIAAGVTVNMRASKLRERSVVWLASGAVTIAGTLSLTGATGYPAGASGNLRVPAEPGPGGYPGGVGVDISSPAQPGAGPGGGPINGFGSCASYATVGSCEQAGAVYGNSLLVPLRGGSGGAGCPSSTCSGGGGGAGGGAIQIASSVSISVTGSLLANGGTQTGGGFFGGPAGMGSGGAIHLEAPLISGNGVVQAIGGQSPTGSAGNGWIRVDTAANSFTGTITPGAIFGPLFNVPLPSAVPAVSITSINSVAVPSVPTGSFTAPDVTITSTAAVPVAIAAANIPVGTVVNLIISSETGTDQVVQATPLAGTTASSTATASIIWPLGVSSVFIRPTW